MILISACLCGFCCRYNGQSATNEEMERLVLNGKGLPVCPEQLGGMPTPREPAEIQNADGRDVIIGKAVILDSAGNDVTGPYVRGAKEVLKICGMFCIQRAILKDGSPSCGAGKIYDGSFMGNLKKGNGVTAALLLENGIKIEAI